MEEETIGEALGISEEEEEKLIQLIQDFAEKDQKISETIKELCERKNLDLKSVLAGYYLGSLDGIKEIKVIATTILPETDEETFEFPYNDLDNCGFGKETLLLREYNGCS